MQITQPDISISDQEDRCVFVLWNYEATKAVKLNLRGYTVADGKL